LWRTIISGVDERVHLGAFEFRIAASEAELETTQWRKFTDFGALVTSSPWISIEGGDSGRPITEDIEVTYYFQVKFAQLSMGQHGQSIVNLPSGPSNTVPVTFEAIPDNWP
jgi:hypothetical protein